MNKLVPNSKLFSAILSNIEDAVIVTTMQGDVILLNEAAEKLTGWKATIGQSIEEVFTIEEVETRNTIKNPVSGVLKSRSNSEFTTAMLVGKESSAVLIEYRIVIIHDHERNMQGGLLVFRDKTEQKKSKEELKRFKKELEAFSHTISHDMRAPLRAVKGYATILKEDYWELLGEEGKSVLAIIDKNTARMDMMIEDLLRFSKLGKEKIIPQKIDVREMVNNLVNDVLVSSPHSFDIVLHDLPAILGDQNMFVQIWTNLLSNAIKFTSQVEKPKIEIGYVTSVNEISFYVKDNGVGFDMQYVDRLFGLFQRLHKASAFEGTGVGLAIVQRIVSKHGGRVWAEGEVNKGATFYFALPKNAKVE